MKILAFSLYGQDPVYTIGAVKNALLHKKIFVDWEMRVYHNNTVPKKILEQLQDNNVTLINVGEDTGYRGSLWRFLPAGENIERFISRDTDSRISKRDECAVEEWIESDKNFHIIREHPIGHNWVINAGMWGCKGNVLTNQSSIMNDFLSRFDSKAMNRSSFNDDNNSTKDLDRKLDDFAFIGESIDENDEPRGDQRTPIINLYNRKND